ncbi:hypothetical protein V8G54_001149, partial [Vigna mungo]
SLGFGLSCRTRWGSVEFLEELILEFIFIFLSAIDLCSILVSLNNLSIMTNTIQKVSCISHYYCCILCTRKSWTCFGITLFIECVLGRISEHYTESKMQQSKEVDVPWGNALVGDIS